MPQVISEHFALQTAVVGGSHALQVKCRPLVAASGPRVQGFTPPAVAQFNLDVDEVQSAARELDPWRRNITQPLVVEVRAVRSRAQVAPTRGMELRGCCLAMSGRRGLLSLIDYVSGIMSVWVKVWYVETVVSLSLGAQSQNASEGVLRATAPAPVPGWRGRLEVHRHQATSRLLTLNAVDPQDVKVLPRRCTFRSGGSKTAAQHMGLPRQVAPHTHHPITLLPPLHLPCEVASSEVMGPADNLVFSHLTWYVP